MCLATISTHIGRSRGRCRGGSSSLSRLFWVCWHWLDVLVSSWSWLDWLLPSFGLFEELVPGSGESCLVTGRGEPRLSLMSNSESDFPLLCLLLPSVLFSDLALSVSAVLGFSVSLFSLVLFSEADPDFSLSAPLSLLESVEIFLFFDGVSPVKRLKHTI